MDSLNFPSKSYGNHIEISDVLICLLCLKFTLIQGFLLFFFFRKVPVLNALRSETGRIGSNESIPEPAKQVFSLNIQFLACKPRNTPNALDKFQRLQTWCIPRQVPFSADQFFFSLWSPQWLLESQHKANTEAWNSLWFWERRLCTETSRWFWAGWEWCGV